MVTKIELQARIGELETEAEDLETLYEEAKQRADRLAAENGAHEERERARMRAEHERLQAERREAEQAEIEARIDAFLDGKIPLSRQAHVRCEREVAEKGRPADLVLKVELPITPTEYEALQAHLNPSPLRFHFAAPLGTPRSVFNSIFSVVD